MAVVTARPLGSLSRAQLDRYWLVSKHAYCRTDPVPEMWIQDQISEVEVREAKMAADLCRKACPVKRLCLAHAMDANELIGVWGGLLQSQRSTFRSLWVAAKDDQVRDLLLDTVEQRYPLSKRVAPARKKRSDARFIPQAHR